MNEQPTLPVDRDGNKPSGTLVERMDPAIGEATSVMGAMLTELLRRTLRGGVRQVGDELQSFVAEKVDETISDRRPVLEQIAVEAADKSARVAATEVATEEVRAAEQRAAEKDRELAGRIEETEKKAEERTASTARELHGRIGQVETKAEEMTASTARGLTQQLQETEKQVREAFQAEVARRVNEVLERSHKGAQLLQARLKGIEETTAELGKQVQGEQNERKAELGAARAELQQRAAAVLHELGQEVKERRAAEDLLRKEVARLRKENEARLRAEVTDLREANRALTDRVAELEKPRGLRALWAWVKRRFTGGKSQSTPAPAATAR
jgi:chromosome segregation ATPase